MSNTNLTIGSLFDGSGGFPLGGLLCGVTPVWASEVEPFPIRVTTKRLPFMKHYGDVSKLSGSELEPVDIITFGSPCQDMSIAGKRDGLDGSRSSLFYEAVRIVKEMRCATNGRYPRYIVWENVPGAFSSNKGEDFKAVLEAVCSVKEDKADIPRQEKWPSAGEIVADDYSVAWRVLDAQYWGVPQRRKRIFLVADFAGQCAGKILFESEGLSGYSAEGFKAWQRTAGSAAPCAGAAGVCLNDQGGERMDVTEEVAATLRAEAHHPPVVMGAAGFCTEHSAKARSIGYEEGRSPTLRAGVVPAVVPIAMNERQYAATVSEDVANTLTGTDYKGTQCVFENHSADTRYDGIEAWMEFYGDGVYTVDMKAGEFIIDSDRQYVLVRVPGPELTNCRITQANRLFWQDGVFDKSISVGTDLAVEMRKAGYTKLNNYMKSNAQFYKSAKSSAQTVIANLVKGLNSELTDLVVEVEFFD